MVLQAKKMLLSLFIRIHSWIYYLLSIANIWDFILYSDFLANLWYILCQHATELTTNQHQMSFLFKALQ